MPVELADDAGRAPDAALAQVGDEARRAEATHLLVVAEGVVDGEGQVGGEEGRRLRHRQADEGLHVGAAAAVEPAVLHFGGERIQRPVLAVPGHGVGVAGDDHAGRLALAEGGEEVGLVPVVVEGERALDAVARELVADEVDELELELRLTVSLRTSAPSRGHAPKEQGQSMRRNISAPAARGGPANQPGRGHSHGEILVLRFAPAKKGRVRQGGVRWDCSKPWACDTRRDAPLPRRRPDAPLAGALRPAASARRRAPRPTRHLADQGLAEGAPRPKLPRRSRPADAIVARSPGRTKADAAAIKAYKALLGPAGKLLARPSSSRPPPT
jgi:hypothetical protein